MKFPVAYYLLFLYISVLIRPLILVGCDAYDHAFEQAIHIATVHAKYGNNHLEMAVADTGKDNNKNNTASQSEDTITVHVLVKQEVIIHGSNSLLTTYPDKGHNKIVNTSLSIIAPPPRA